MFKCERAYWMALITEVVDVRATRCEPPFVVQPGRVLALAIQAINNADDVRQCGATDTRADRGDFQLEQAIRGVSASWITELRDLTIWAVQPQRLPAFLWC